MEKSDKHTLPDDGYQNIKETHSDGTGNGDSSSPVADIPDNGKIDGSAIEKTPRSRNNKIDTMSEVLKTVQENQLSIHKKLVKYRNGSSRNDSNLSSDCVHDVENDEDVKPKDEAIPAHIFLRHPLITKDGFANLQRIAQNKDAPRWNYFTIGDKVIKSDLDRVEAFREAFERLPNRQSEIPPDSILKFVEETRKKSLWFHDSLPAGMDLKSRWHEIRTMSRQDIAVNLYDIVPTSDNYDRLIVYDTSGTTGHSIVVPHHPRTLALNHVHCEHVLNAYNKKADFGPNMTACINACAQQYTYVFCNIFSVWNQAAFAKVNLNADEWATGVEGAKRFFDSTSPHFISADPVTIAEMMKWEICVRPALILSTALELSPKLKEMAEAYFQCPVVNWYSTIETGPIAFSPPGEINLKIFGPDIFVELLDDDGFPVAPGERGEITVTGGRNPWLPLLRYRTGDYAVFHATENDNMLHDFQGRQPVIFRTCNDSIVNSVDIGRALRLACPFVQHQFIQHEDRSCTLKIHPLPSVNICYTTVKNAIKELFGESLILTIKLEEMNTESKVMPFISFVS